MGGNLRPHCETVDSPRLSAMALPKVNWSGDWALLSRNGRRGMWAAPHQVGLGRVIKFSRLDCYAGFSRSGLCDADDFDALRAPASKMRFRKRFVRPQPPSAGGCGRIGGDDRISS